MWSGRGGRPNGLKQNPGGFVNRRTVVGGGIAAAVAAAGVVAAATLLPTASQREAGSREERERGANWTTGAKQGLGTATTTSSKVWYTLAQGVMTDVFYPTLDHSDVQDLQFIIVDNARRAELERDATSHRVEQVDPKALIYRQVNEKASRYRITNTFVTDPARSTVLMHVAFQWLDGAPYQLYVLYNPSLGNSALHDSGRTDSTDRGLSASDGKFNSYLKGGHGATFSKMSNGYSANNDGWSDLQSDGRMDLAADRADEGNLVQTAQLTPATSAPSCGLQLALGFGSSTEEAKATANATLATPGGFGAVRDAYTGGWKRYVSTLKPPPPSVAGDPRLTDVYLTSVMALHAGEDKTHRGAQVAALATPWGDQKFDQAKEDVIRDYHAVWSRDAYQQATGLLAAGDQAQADRILTFLLTGQQLKENGKFLGEFPRFSKVDGTALEGAHQMDEAAFPLILAWQLRRTDAATWPHIERIANRIAAAGPATGTERWEEQGGRSPSTIATEIAGLVCAADLARARGQDETAKKWEQTADQWRRQLPDWTFVTSGSLGAGKYYERIDDTEQPNPNDDRVRDWIGGGTREAKEKEVLDSGFLELVRLGVVSANDPKVVGSLAELDEKTSINLPKGRYYYRYNPGLDGYGEEPSGKGWTDNGAGFGRPWPVLTGERGEYELAAGRSATKELAAMASAANEGNLLPEQVWDKPDISAAGLRVNQPTGSATPLGWAAGQYVRLAQSISAGRPVETPSVVAARYVNSRR